MFDMTDDFNPTPAPTKSQAQERTLLLCPPSVASDPHLLESHLSALDRTTTDVQMLDRLSMGLVSLPTATYTTVRLLPGSTTPLTPALLAQINTTMKPGARWTSPENAEWTKDKLAFLIAGFMVDGDVVSKPDFGPQKTVALKPRAKTTAAATAPKVVVPKKVPRQEVQFDMGDDLDDDDDDELIDEDELMADETLATAAQMRKSIMVPCE